MKLFLLPLASLLFVSITLVLVEASHEINITRGSFLSTDSSPNNESTSSTYWLSPSGNIAFGFYPLCSDCQHYIVGIWLVKSAKKTLLWSTNRNDPPLRHPSSILFNNDGKLVLRTADDRENPLLINMWELASYAAILDNGNFVLYDSNSKILWESFDYPTDTIVGGQILKTGQNLISSVFKSHKEDYSYKLRIEQQDCDLLTYQMIPDSRSGTYVDYVVEYVSSNCGSTKRKQVGPVSLNLDPNTGRIYLVDWNDLVLKNITDGENQQQQEDRLYRATLDTDGVFRLYKEVTGIKDGESSLLWYSSDKRRSVKEQWVRIGILLGSSLGATFLCFGCIHCWFLWSRRRRERNIAAISS